MDLLRLFALAGCFLSAMLGGLYATTRASRGSGRVGETAPANVTMPVVEAAPAETSDAAPIPSGRDVPRDALEEADEPEVLVDTLTGVAIGPLAIAAADREDEQPAARRAPTPSARRTRPAPGPRLDADPGRHVILTARGMMSRGETVRGSCYAYLSEVFDRAGHDGWRTRAVVFQGSPNGPYADLDLIRPGDWLYIVNNPDATPVGTHSVLFVGWEDRANGYARTISHAGWAAGASPGRESHYDVTRTYRVIRPRLER